MTEFRYCKFKDGSIKNFEDICAGDIFQIFEPDGVLLDSKDSRKFTWFKAERGYDDLKDGFSGVWVDDTTD